MVKLGATLAILIALTSAAAAQPAVPHWPDDFRFLGTTTLPSAPWPANGDSNFGKGLAVRLEKDGTVTLFTGSWAPQVVLTWQAPRGADGTFSGSAAFTGNLGTPPLHYYLFGLYWDPPTSMLYASSQNDYDGSGTIDMSLGRATIDPVTGKLAAAGSYTFAGRSDKFTQGGITALPDWFQKAYGCGRLAVGWGGYWSVIATGPASMGPAGACFDPPDASVTKGAIANTALLGYPYSSSTVTHTAAAERDADYTQTFGWGWWPKHVPADPGFWVPGDSLWQGCAYVDTGAVSGLLCVPMLHNGCVWYGDNAIPQKPPECSTTPGKAAALNSTRARHWVYIYDPRDLGAVATGQKAQNAIQAAQRVPLDLPGVPQPLTGWPNIPRMVTGVSFEPTSGLFAVMIRNAALGGHPTVFWYQVRRTQSFTITRTRTTTATDALTVQAVSETDAIALAKAVAAGWTVVSTASAPETYAVGGQP